MTAVILSLAMLIGPRPGSAEVACQVWSTYTYNWATRQYAYTKGRKAWCRDGREMQVRR